MNLIAHLLKVSCNQGFLAFLIFYLYRILLNLPIHFLRISIPIAMHSGSYPVFQGRRPGPVEGLMFQFYMNQFDRILL